MKIIFILLLSVVLGKGCDNDNKQELENTKLEYSAYSRGFYLKITIQNKVVAVSKERGKDEKVIATIVNDSIWSVLVKEFKEIDLKKLSTYKPLSEKRFYDGAAIAKLTVIYKDSTYNSKDFDHQNPPVEIANLVNTINQIAK